MEQVFVPELEPPELNKRSHAVRNLAKEKDTPVVQLVPDPAPEACVRFGGVHAADRWVLPAALYLDGAKNNPEGPLDTIRRNHFIRLPSIGRVECGRRHMLSTPNTPEAATRTTFKLLAHFFFDDFLSSA